MLFLSFIYFHVYVAKKEEEKKKKSIKPNLLNLLEQKSIHHTISIPTILPPTRYITYPVLSSSLIIDQSRKCLLGLL